MGNHLSSRNLLGSQSNKLACDWLTTPENIGGHGRGRGGAIGVMNLIDVGGVRDVRNVGHVPDVGDVDLANVGFTAVIPGKEWLARSEWKPRGQFAAADSDANRKVRTTHEGNQGGRVNGCDNHWPGQPSPSNSNVHPATIVEWTEAPRFIFYPGPAPRTDPCPMAEAIGNPANS
jgi:hypothetical protein